MKSTFANIVSSLPADYADLRFEENRKIRIGYEGKELSQVATTLTSGGHVRVYAKGGKAISSFSDPGRAGLIAEATLVPDFDRVCPKPSNSPVNSLVTVFLRMVA